MREKHIFISRKSCSPFSKQSESVYVENVFYDYLSILEDNLIKGGFLSQQNYYPQNVQHIHV